jgi:pyruvate kinase
MSSNPDSASAERGARQEDVPRLIEELMRLRDEICRTEARFRDEIDRLDSRQRDSARNLLHYVTLRRQDIRPLQERLVPLGLSSLGRCESYVLANVDAVLGLLGQVAGVAIAPPAVQEISYARGRELIESRTKTLLGEKPVHRGVHIMVTLPTEAAESPELVRDLLAAGMNCARINCAHDDAAAWQRMIQHLRHAEAELGRSCRIMMDLAGPKIRTGPIQAGPRVLRWRPKRNSYGEVVAPARIWLPANAGALQPPSPADAVLPVESDWLREVQVGDEIQFRDARDRARTIKIVGAASEGMWGECERTAYLRPGIALRHVKPSGEREAGSEMLVGDIPPLDQYLVLYRGDRLLVTDDGKPGTPPRYDERGQLVSPATVGCTLPEVFQHVRGGDRILFDDGKIGGVVEKVHAQYLVVRITQAREKGERLRSDKGINLPDSHLRLPALTEKDIRDLEFVVRHADAVNYSFVRRPDDVYRLQAELQRLGRPDLGIILKIENTKAFQRMARLLLAVMRSPVAGVMIARGDLAVECGWQRLAEVQEELLWMCEAAHMPVIWATQVLESLAKKGLPSRAEVTDAAMSVRAECVMLNKGSHILETVRTLDDILRRMGDHQVKKRPMLRRLSLADDLLPVDE